MATTSPTPERQAIDERGAERERDLQEIDSLIAQCRSRMEGVSGEVLSSATKADTASMYESLRREAESDELRAERLAWMRTNVHLLQRTIEKAARESAVFGQEIGEAAMWLGTGPAESLRAWFYSPGSLEMYRSMWFKDEWQQMKARGKKLLEDRTKALSAATAAKLAAKDSSALAKVQNAERFANLRTEADKRSAIDQLEADILAAQDGNLSLMRRMEAMLAPHAKGKNRCLHPAKLGAWLKKIAADPKRYTAAVLQGYVSEWQALRAERDALQAEYRAAGKPDGCAPLDVNPFLELPVDARRAMLAEWRNRLDAAKRHEEAESDAFERAKRDLRAAVDIRDLDDAETRLAALRADRPYDRDLVSIAAHVALLREEDAANGEREEEADRTESARRELDELRVGVPSVVAAHYAYLVENGDAEEMAAFSKAMMRRVERKQAGETDAREEYAAALEAEEAEEAEVVAPADAEADDADVADAEVHINAGTPPSATFRLLRQREAVGGPRSAALVIGGLPIDQQAQLVRVNRRMLENKRHLDAAEEADPALAPAA